MMGETSLYSGEDMFASVVAGKESLLQLPVDIKQTAEGFILFAQMPGVPIEDISISIAGDVGVITIEGIRSPQYLSKEDDTLLTQECSWGKVYRRIILPEPVKSDSAVADLGDGVLTIELQKDNSEVYTKNSFYEEN